MIAGVPVAYHDTSIRRPLLLKLEWARGPLELLEAVTDEHRDRTTQTARVAR